ncbi:AAA family ATPase [Deinococcus aquaticus]|uniref:ATP-binding protein n=1 Tax=Deinococcus aquaticus TaxID=328692 RepID=A0ABY7V8S3_9DEIO|nr:ATP-binding protein [Deinococcus aquaticus]WDA60697.1 ATP-binding protein [Deinococcus aquaticus]
MSTANHVLALVKSHISGDDDAFLSVVLQVAAREARSGHSNVAIELRKLIDQARARDGLPKPETPLPIAFQPTPPKGDLATLLSVSHPRQRLKDLVVEESADRRLARIVHEYAQQDQLRSHGLSPRRKILMIGPPGSGKTMTAHALAGELSLPLMTILLEGIITKFMGETASKLRTVFEAMASMRGVYFFDEFDAIGARRSSGNDVGEIRRVLNSFLQFLEKDESTSLIMAATNHPELLDPALFRRFDDVIEYGLPDAKVAERILKVRLARFAPGRFSWTSAVEAADGLSHAEITRAADEAAKSAVLSSRMKISTKDLLEAIEERKLARQNPSGR